MVKKKSKSKIVVTEKDRKKYGVCEHDQVNYKALNKMCDGLLLHCKRLSRDINRKGKWIEIWMKTHKILQDEIKLKNKNSILKETLYLKKLNDLKANYNLTIDDWIIQNDQLKADLKEAIEVNKNVIVKNRDCIKANTEILKDHNEIVRAYNGLAEMGKFAEDEGIDIKKHNKMLPENDKYKFSQSHTLLESGRVKHSWKLKPKKNGKGN